MEQESNGNQFATFFIQNKKKLIINISACKFTEKYLKS